MDVMAILNNYLQDGAPPYLIKLVYKELNKDLWYIYS